MPDILHDFPISAPISKAFAAVSTPAGSISGGYKHDRDRVKRVLVIDSGGSGKV